MYIQKLYFIALKQVTSLDLFRFSNDKTVNVIAVTVVVLSISFHY